MFKTICILSNEVMFIKSGKKSMYQAYYEAFFPKQLPDDFKDIFEEPDILRSILKNMITSNKNHPLKGKLIKPSITIMLIDEYHLKLRKRMLEELFNAAGFRRIFFVEISSLASSAVTNEGWKIPSIVMTKIASQMQIDFTFGGFLLKSQLLKNYQEHDLDLFVSECIDILESPLEEHINKSTISSEDYHLLKKLWESSSKNDIDYIYCTQSGRLDIHDCGKQWKVISFEEIHEKMLDIR